MRKGEGLVGLIADEAEPRQARRTPSRIRPSPTSRRRARRSTTPSSACRSCAAGNTLGVLVVQNKAHRTYSEEEIEALQTTAMVLAEMIASGELAGAGDGPEPSRPAGRPHACRGARCREGIGLGHVVLHEPRVVVKNIIAEDVDAELERLDAAIASLRASIDEMLDDGDIARAGEHRDVLETFRMFANDRGWVRRLREAVQTGITAEAAVERVQSDTRARMLRQTDPYLRERLHDLDDLANRLLRELTDARPRHGPDARGTARQRHPRGALHGAGGAARLRPHAAARPRAGGGRRDEPRRDRRAGARHRRPSARSRTRPGSSKPGDAIIVDGVSGEVQVRPTGDVERAYADKVRFRARKQEQYRALRDKPSATRDGAEVKLMLNAGLLVDLPHLAETGAAGIGLFRTELQFMIASSMPRTAAQQQLYRAVLDAAGDKPVTFRTLDIGGDKILPYMHNEAEENPALGWRAIRLGLDRPALMRTQIRALLNAAGGRDLRIMFPMVACVSEFEDARDIVRRERARLIKHDQPVPSSIALGVMVEVPSLLFQLDEILARVDFLSVGSNDLMQFLFAVDRGNARVVGPLRPAEPGLPAGARHDRAPRQARRASR